MGAFRRMAFLRLAALTCVFAGARAVDQVVEEVCEDQAWDDVALLQRFRRSSSSSADFLSLEEAAKRAGDMARDLTREEIQGLIRGTGYSDNMWNPPDGHFVGNTDPIPHKGIPSLNLQDNGQGYRTVHVKQIGQVTSFPSSLAVAATWDEALGREWGEALGEEFLAKGANVLLGPGLNVHRVARCGRNVEYISGESPYLGSRLVKGYIEGVHSKHVLTVMKHFITNNQETNRNTVNSIVDERTLWEVYYPPFVAATAAGCLLTMCSYNVVNGIHACSSPDILIGDLKSRMGYLGAVMSDWWALHDFSAREGLDMEQPGNSIIGNANNQAYFTPNNTKSLPWDKETSMAARILTGVIRYGLIENPVCAPANGGCSKEVYEVVATTKAHQDLAKRIVANSVILLKNENEVLPFPEGTKTIALLGSACDAPNDVGPMLDKWDLGNYYTVGGSGRVIPKDPSSILKATKEYGKEAGCQVVTELKDDAEAAQELADQADLAVLCSATTSAEGADRENLSVDQEDYVVKVAASLSIPKVSVSIIPGAIVMPWVHDVDAAVVMFLGGEATGTGLLEVLSGAVNPGAKSPVTFPFTEEDAIPPCEEVRCEYKEGAWAGFSIYEDKEVTFPFGHGLSYTSFSYELHSIATSCGNADANVVVCAEVQLMNTGDRGGSEVVQLYLGFPKEAKLPKKLLRGFEKVQVGAGDVRLVQIPLRQQDLAIWSTQEDGWVVPDGKFNVFVGASSRDIRVVSQFSVLNEEIEFSV